MTEFPCAKWKSNEFGWKKLGKKIVKTVGWEQNKKPKKQ